MVLYNRPSTWKLRLDWTWKMVLIAHGVILHALMSPAKLRSCAFAIRASLKQVIDSSLTGTKKRGSQPVIYEVRGEPFSEEDKYELLYLDGSGSTGNSRSQRMDLRRKMESLARTLLEAPGLTTRSKDATRG